MKSLVFNIFILFFSSPLTCNNSGDSSKELYYDRLLNGMTKFMTWATGGLGVSTAIVIPDEGCWQGTAGFSYDDRPMTENMVFNIASVGKNFLAVLILQLAEEKRLSLEDTIGRWLPEYRNIDHGITIRQLLNHTSGLSDWVSHPGSPYMIPFDSIKFSKWWRWDEIMKMVDNPLSPPAKNWHYSTANYNILGKIVQEITGNSAGQEVINRFITPENLNNIYLCDSIFSPPDKFEVAHGWFDINGDGIPEDIYDRPRSWIISLSPLMMFANAMDLARWSAALYGDGIIDPETRQEMLDFHHPTPGEPPVTGYGLGTAEFAHPSIKSLRAYGHLGYHYGYMTAMMYFPESKASMAVMINSNNIKHITAVVFGLWYVVELTHSFPSLLISWMVFNYIFMLIVLPFFLIIRWLRIKYHLSTSG